MDKFLKRGKMQSNSCTSSSTDTSSPVKKAKKSDKSSRQNVGEDQPVRHKSPCQRKMKRKISPISKNAKRNRKTKSEKKPKRQLLQDEKQEKVLKVDSTDDEDDEVSFVVPISVPESNVNSSPVVVEKVEFVPFRPTPPSEVELQQEAERVVHLPLPQTFKSDQVHEAKRKFVDMKMKPNNKKLQTYEFEFDRSDYKQSKVTSTENNQQDHLNRMMVLKKTNLVCQALSDIGSNCVVCLGNDKLSDEVRSAKIKEYEVYQEKKTKGLISLTEKKKKNHKK